MSNNKLGFSFKNFFTTLTTKKAILVIITVGFIVFFNSLFNGFVWDDKVFIINNPYIHQFSLISPFLPNNKFNDTRYYRPIPAAYFSLLYSLFGQQAFFYHFFQISLHITCTILLYFFFCTIINSNSTKIEEQPNMTSVNENDWKSLSNRQKKKLRKMYHGMQVQTLKPSHIANVKTTFLSLFLSLVFLVHPIQVESVSFIGATQSELFFIPGILALYLARKKQISTRRFLSINGLLLLSILTKETSLLFIPLLVIYRYMFFDTGSKVKQYIISGTLITGFYLCIRFLIGKVGFHNIKQEVPIASLSLLERLLNIPSILVYYLKTFIFPVNLAIWQSWVIKKVTEENFILPSIICIAFFFALICITFLIFRNNRAQFKIFIFFVSWYLLGMGLILQIFPLDMTVSDRWFYFPLVGLLGMAGIGLQSLVKTETVEKVVFGCCISILVLLSVRSIVRNTNFYDDITLYTHDGHILDNSFIENNLGIEYYNTKNYHQALKHFQKSVELRPTLLNLQNSGSVYELMNNKKVAQQYFYKLLDLNVNDYEMNNYDGAVVYASAQLLFYDTPSNAFRYINLALKKDPNSGYLWANYAISAFVLHIQPTALMAAQKAKTFYPSDKTNQLYTLISQKQNITSSMIFVRHF